MGKLSSTYLNPNFSTELIWREMEAYRVSSKPITSRLLLVHQSQYYHTQRTHIINLKFYLYHFFDCDRYMCQLFDP